MAHFNFEILFTCVNSIWKAWYDYGFVKSYTRQTLINTWFNALQENKTLLILVSPVLQKKKKLT